MSTIINNPLLGIVISLITFEVGCFFSKKTRFVLFNPLLISISLIILFLKSFNISLEAYNNGGQFISFFLGPATVILAVPLYKKIDLLKANIFPILTGIITGSSIGMISIIFLCKLFDLDKVLTSSLVPKSITAPIGIEISKQLNGIPALTVAAIIITGILGSIIAPIICKIFKINNKIAFGIAIGTASHAVGTSKALEIGETEGAMSGLAIGVAGLVTVILAPILFGLFF